jgi:hypothetical protein
MYVHEWRSRLTLLLVSYLDPLEEKEWLIFKRGDDKEKVNSNSTYTLEHYVDTPVRTQYRGLVKSH